MIGRRFKSVFGDSTGRSGERCFRGYTTICLSSGTSHKSDRTFST